MKERFRIICVDFDGTLAVHQFPGIGVEVPKAFEVCKRLQEDGCRLILHTVRSEESLDEAVAWCKERGLEFWGINKNPSQYKFSSSRKTYANLYIDDAAFGCPLIPVEGHKPMVDWSKVEEWLLENGWIK